MKLSILITNLWLKILSVRGSIIYICSVQGWLNDFRKWSCFLRKTGKNRQIRLINPFLQIPFVVYLLSVFLLKVKEAFWFFIDHGQKKLLCWRDSANSIFIDSDTIYVPFIKYRMFKVNKFYKKELYTVQCIHCTLYRVFMSWQDEKVRMLMCYTVSWLRCIVPIYKSSCLAHCLSRTLQQYRCPLQYDVHLLSLLALQSVPCIPKTSGSTH